MNNIRIGADPELFLEKDGEVISAEGLVGGTKKSPRKITEEGHAVQEDNIMVEFNIPPASTCEEFKAGIKHVLEYLTTFAEIHSCKLSKLASAKVNRIYLRTPQAKEFGCDPDFNVYTQQINDKVMPKTTLRTCGGHIHVGYENPTQEVSENIIKAMDMILGLESLQLDTDDQRRSMYGGAGSFRFKEYGVEYRTLSNFWIMSDDMIEWAYTKTMKALDIVKSGEIDELYEEFGDVVQRCINTNNKDLAKRVLKEIEKKQLTTA
jgi:hypothetical protein